VARAALAVIVLALALPPGATAQSGSGVIQDDPAVLDPQATVVGGTPTPEPSGTPLPLETATPEANETVTPVPTREAYRSPGYGNAARQPDTYKRDEQKKACGSAKRPPTSTMLSIPGTVSGDPGGSWVPVVVAVALGAALFAAIAFAIRRQANKETAPGPFEALAALVAVCGGLAGLAAQFIPSASVDERPAPEATMVVRDVKPRITRREYMIRSNLSRAGFKPIDLDEIGNVVWIELGLKGFKHRKVRIDYGLYDLNAHEALLPGSSKTLPLEMPKHDVQTSFVPVWVGYPRAARFMAEFRLVDRQGVQQIAATHAMRASAFRYECDKPD
jgi:hypothetical protein